MTWIDDLLGVKEVSEDGNPPFPRRTIIDFFGPGVAVTDDPVNERTRVEISAATFDYKDSVVTATFGALPANTRTGNVMTADANGVLPALDGTSPVVSDRVLVKDEAAPVDNGVYTVTDLGSVSTPWVLTRADDFDEDSEVTAGAIVPVENVTSNARLYMLTTPDPIVVNTDALNFSDLAGGSGLTAPTNPGENNRMAYGLNGDLSYASGVTTDGTDLTVVGRLVTTSNVVGTGFPGFTVGSATAAAVAIAVPTSTSGAGGNLLLGGGSALAASGLAGGDAFLGGGNGDGAGAGGAGVVSGGAGGTNGNVVFRTNGGITTIATWLGATVGRLEWEQAATPSLRQAQKTAGGDAADFEIRTQAPQGGGGRGGDLILDATGGDGGRDGRVQFEIDNTRTAYWELGTLFGDSVRDLLVTIETPPLATTSGSDLTLRAASGGGDGSAFGGDTIVQAGEANSGGGPGVVQLQTGPGAVLVEVGGSGASPHVALLQNIGAVATTGDIRMPHDWELDVQTNGGADFTLISWGNEGNDLFVLGNGSVAEQIYRSAGTHRFESTGGVDQVEITAASVELFVRDFIWDSAEVLPRLFQETDSTADAIGDELLIHAQDVDGSGTQINGASLRLRGGNANAGSATTLVGGDTTLDTGTGDASNPGRINLAEAGTNYAQFLTVGGTIYALRGNNGRDFVISVQDASSGAGDGLVLQGAAANSGAGGPVDINGGAAAGTNEDGGTVTLSAGTLQGTGNSDIVFAVSGNEILRLRRSGTATASQIGVFGASPVARPAAYTITNPATRRSFDTTTVTLSQLAEVVGTHLQDFIDRGDLQ